MIRQAAIGIVLSCAVWGQTVHSQASAPPANPSDNLEYSVPVRVPPEVRNDIVNTAVRFYAAAFPETPRATFEQAFAPCRAKEEWQVRPKRGTLPAITLGSPLGEIMLSFPEPGMWMLLQASPETVRLTEQGLTEQQAASKAEAVFRRLIPDRAERETLERRDSSRPGACYWLSRCSTINPDFRNTRSVMVAVSRRTGDVVVCHLDWEPAPVLKPGLIDKKALLDETIAIYYRASESRYKLLLMHDFERDIICWEYGVIYADDRDDTVRDTTCWDAYTGEMVSSSQVDSKVVAARMVRPDGSRQSEGCYWNEKYFPRMTEKEVIARLEAMAQARAEKLKAEKAAAAPADADQGKATP